MYLKFLAILCKSIKLLPIDFIPFLLLLVSNNVNISFASKMETIQFNNKCVCFKLGPKDFFSFKKNY